MHARTQILIFFTTSEMTNAISLVYQIKLFWPCYNLFWIKYKTWSTCIKSKSWIFCFFKVDNQQNLAVHNFDIIVARLNRRTLYRILYMCIMYMLHVFVYNLQAGLLVSAVYRAVWYNQRPYFKWRQLESCCCRYSKTLTRCQDWCSTVGGHRREKKKKKKKLISIAQ